MASWNDDFRPILVAISNLSGSRYRDVDGPELREELQRLGLDLDPITFRNRMFELRRAGYVGDFHPSWEWDDWGLIRLEERGRQQVEGWPSGGAINSADFDALVELLTERADDLELPEEQRGRLRAAGTTIAGLGTSVGVNVLTAWIERQTGLS